MLGRKRFSGVQRAITATRATEASRSAAQAAQIYSPDILLALVKKRMHRMILIFEQKVTMETKNLRIERGVDWNRNIDRGTQSFLRGSKRSQAPLRGERSSLFRRR
jgi:hypothetical protein